jgi:hypothetical protein
MVGRKRVGNDRHKERVGKQTTTFSPAIIDDSDMNEGIVVRSDSPPFHHAITDATPLIPRYTFRSLHRHSISLYFYVFSILVNSAGQIIPKFHM